MVVTEMVCCVQNRLQEAIVLYSSVLNSQWFVRTSVILFLNKRDIFIEKIKAGKSIRSAFAEYTGAHNPDKYIGVQVGPQWTTPSNT